MNQQPDELAKSLSASCGENDAYFVTTREIRLLLNGHTQKKWVRISSNDWPNDWVEEKLAYGNSKTGKKNDN